VVTFSICWFLYKFFQSYDLKPVGQVVVLMSLYGLLGMPLYQLGKFFYVPGRLEQVKKPRFYTSLGIVVALLLAALFLPLPYSVVCPLEIQARDALPVYVDVAGKLLELDVRPGQQVAAGQQLAQLRSIDTIVEITKLKGSEKEYEAKLESLMQQSFRDRRAADQIPQLQEALNSVREQLQEKERDRQRLRLVAPAAGTVLPPPLTPAHERNEDDKLPPWSGNTLDRENLGATFEQGVLFCQIGDPKRLEAVLVLDQADRNMIREKQSVDLKIEGLPSTTFRSEVAEIAESELKVTPQRLSTRSGGEVPSKADPHSNIERPMSTSYQVRVPLDDADGLVRLGIRGQARIYTSWIPLGTRLWRLLANTFNFKM
jgi:putative peptide zinc metalloprotease protein